MPIGFDTYGTNSGITSGIGNLIDGINPILPTSPHIGIQPLPQKPNIQDKIDVGTNLPKPPTEEQKAEKEAAEAVKSLEAKEEEERRHAEEREDTAYQRAIEDMRKAGWNTDGMSPMGSESAARLDTTRSEGEKERQLKLKMLKIELAQAVKEGDKDRAVKIQSEIIKLAGKAIPW